MRWSHACGWKWLLLFHCCACPRRWSQLWGVTLSLNVFAVRSTGYALGNVLPNMSKGLQYSGHSYPHPLKKSTISPGCPQKTNSPRLIIAIRLKTWEQKVKGQSTSCHLVSLFCVGTHPEQLWAWLMDGHHHYAVSFGQLSQQHHDLIGRHAVQTGGRLVQQDHPWSGSIQKITQVTRRTGTSFNELETFKCTSSFRGLSVGPTEVKKISKFFFFFRRLL